MKDTTDRLCKAINVLIVVLLIYGVILCIDIVMLLVKWVW